MKSKITVIFLGILIFLLGGVAGGVSYNLYWRYFKKPPKPLSFVEILAEDLKLDANQKEKLRAIAKETRGRVVAANKQFKPQYEAINIELWSLMDEIREESDQKIKNILHEDQKALFEQFLKKIYKPPQRDGAPRNEKKQPGLSN